jgi:integrase
MTTEAKTEAGIVENPTPEDSAAKPYRTRALLVKIPNVPCLYRHSVNGRYYAVKKVNGKIKNHSLDTGDRRTAERQLRQWLKDLDKVDVQAAKSTLSELLEKFVQTRKGYSTKTQKTEESIIKAFKATWAHGLDIRVSDILPSMIDSWLASQESNLMNSSYNRYTMFIRGLFEVAKGDRMIAEVPTLKKSWKDPRKTARLRIVPTDEQFSAIVDSIRQETQNVHAEESANFIAFQGLAGLGQAELDQLTWGDIHWDRPPIGWFSCRRKKTGKPFDVPIYPELKPLLEKMFKAAHKDGNPPTADSKLFTIKDARKSLAHACARLKLPPFYQRSIRAYHIGKLWRKKVDVKKIAAWQGHSDGGKLIMSVYTEVFGSDDTDYVASELAKLA